MLHVPLSGGQTLTLRELTTRFDPPPEEEEAPEENKPEAPTRPPITVDLSYPINPSPLPTPRPICNSAISGGQATAIIEQKKDEKNTMTNNANMMEQVKKNLQSIHIAFEGASTDIEDKNESLLVMAERVSILETQLKEAQSSIQQLTSDLEAAKDSNSAITEEVQLVNSKISEVSSAIPVPPAEPKQNGTGDKVKEDTAEKEMEIGDGICTAANDTALIPSGESTLHTTNEVKREESSNPHQQIDRIQSHIDDISATNTLLRTRNDKLENRFETELLKEKEKIMLGLLKCNSVKSVADVVNQNFDFQLAIEMYAREEEEEEKIEKEKDKASDLHHEESDDDDDEEKHAIQNPWIPAICTAMEQNLDSVEIQEEGMNILSQFAASTTLNRVAIREANGITAILTSMKTHTDTDIDISSNLQIAACTALKHMTKVDGIHRDLIFQHDGIRTLIEIMKRHLGHHQLQKEACSLMANLAFENTNNKNAIREAHGIVVLLLGMKHHLDASAEVQEMGCLALWKLSFENATNRDAIRDAGGLNAIRNAMTVYKDVATVQKQACGALMNLSHQNNVNKDEIRKVGILPLIITAMDVHINDALVQKHACGALNNLTAPSENMKVLMDAEAKRYLVVAGTKFRKECGPLARAALKKIPAVE